MILYKTIADISDSSTLLPFQIMKHKDLQNLVLSKYEKGDGSTKIFHDLNGAISLSTIERWCRTIHETGSINLSKSLGRPRTMTYLL